MLSRIRFEKGVRMLVEHRNKYISIKRELNQHDVEQRRIQTEQRKRIEQLEDALSGLGDNGREALRRIKEQA